MATWNRGRHILPSVRSVLQQSLIDFELLVVGDAITDDTESQLALIDDARLKWLNNPTRRGTQSGPNNRGISEAKAPIVAYCGHDDIWAPNHLEELLRKYRENSKLDVVSSGVVIRRPNSRAPYKIEGMFEDLSPFDTKVFTAPSGFSHRIDRLKVPEWKMREDTPQSVDYAFQAELAELGYSYGSTGKITVHKWTANGRYLAYLVLESVEQEALLERLQLSGFSSEIDKIIEVTKSTGFFMQSKPLIATADSQRTATSDHVRGIVRPDNISLKHGVLLEQDKNPRGHDWRPMHKAERGLRWCGPNVRPKLLINVVSDYEAKFEIDLVARREVGFPNMSVTLNSQDVRTQLEKPVRLKQHLLTRLCFEGWLRPDDASVVEFRLPDNLFDSEGPIATMGFAVGHIRITPLNDVSKLKQERGTEKSVFRKLADWLTGS
jgi:glycosyl transferase family 2